MNTRIADSVVMSLWMPLLVLASSALNPSSATETLATSAVAVATNTPHEHGVAKLMLAVGGDGVEIQMETSAINVFGVASAPQDEDGKKRLATVQRKLEAGDGLFEMNTEAGCSLLAAEVSSPLLANTPPEQTGTADARDWHSDVDISWSFSCAKPETLKSISTRLFKAFPGGFTRIHAEWITETQESATDLTDDGVILLNQE